MFILESRVGLNLVHFDLECFLVKVFLWYKQHGYTSTFLIEIDKSSFAWSITGMHKGVEVSYQ